MCIGSEPMVPETGLTDKVVCRDKLSVALIGDAHSSERETSR